METPAATPKSLLVACIAMLAPVVVVAIAIFDFDGIDSLLFYQSVIVVGAATFLAQLGCSTFAITGIVREPRLATVGNIGLLLLVLSFAIGLAVCVVFLVHGLSA
jgi:hypothetical protein